MFKFVDDKVKKMETILSQRYNYAIITPYKNYSKLTDKKNNMGNTFNFDLDDLKIEDDDDIFGHAVSEKGVKRKKNTKGMIYSLPKAKYKRFAYFTLNDLSFSENFSIQYCSEKKNIFTTEKDYQILRHYGNPFSRVELYTSERTIKKDDTKVSIRIYENFKYRGFNSKYYKKNTLSLGMTIDLKNGNITFSKTNKVKRSKSSSVFRNTFSQLKTEFSYYLFDSHFSDFEKKIDDENLRNKISNNFKITEFVSVIYDTLGIDKTNKVLDSRNDFIDTIIKYFTEKKKIKIPNGEINYFITDLYPTEKFLKKNDRKLISSVLDSLGLKSKFSIKILHEFPSLNLYAYGVLSKIFGTEYHKYFGNLNRGHFIKSKNDVTYPIKYSLNTFILPYELTSIEKDNLISLMNNSIDSYFKSEKIIVLLDHLNMIKDLQEYDPTIIFKSKTPEEFRRYHSEISALTTKLKKGWVVEYIFSDKMVKEVEEPITFVVENNWVTHDEINVKPVPIKLTFYPFILKREEEYEEEGKFMHHCVATYAKKDKSIIISVRTDDGSDRVTCEYNCQDGRLIQARHFCNASPPADIAVSVEKLTEKVKKYARLGMLHAIEQKKVPLKINGIDVIKSVPTTPFEDIFWI
jgi:hypothetical protein